MIKAVSKEYGQVQLLINLAVCHKKTCFLPDCGVSLHQTKLLAMGLAERAPERNELLEQIEKHKEYWM